MTDVKECDNCNFYGCEELQIQTGLNRHLRERLQQALKENEKLRNKSYIDAVSGNIYKFSDLIKSQQKLEKIKECVNKACINGCKCIDKIDILKILEDE